VNRLKAGQLRYDGMARYGRNDMHCIHKIFYLTVARETVD